MESLEPRQLLSVSPLLATIGQQATGPNSLAGKVVYTKGGHGYTWMNGEWETQRPYESYGGGIVEDFGNEDRDNQWCLPVGRRHALHQRDAINERSLGSQLHGFVDHN